MKPGEVFNPRFEACGFHPEEIVSKRRDLTDGQKWLYDRLVRWARSTDGERPNERAGEVWRSHGNIGIELGKSAKQIGRDLAELESERLINHRKRDGRKSNTYVFLFHEDFERTPTSGQTVEATECERTRMSTQKAGEAPPAENLNGHPRPVRTDLNGHPRPSNQKVFNQKEHTRSEDSGRLKEQPAANGATATTTAIWERQTTATSTAIRGKHIPPAAAPAPRPSWPMGGWDSAEEFETWWARVVREHPNKGRNGVAKTKALELLMAGELDRSGFDAGYAALRRANEQRWTEEHCRYAPNLWQLLDDRAWKYACDAGPPRPPVPEYQSAPDYWERMQAE